MVLFKYISFFFFNVYFQASHTSSPSTKGVSSLDRVSESNGQGTPPPSDLAELPKLKGIGRNRRTRFSLKRHLQKHAMQHSDSVSSVDSAGVFMSGREWECQTMSLVNESRICCKSDHSEHIWQMQSDQQNIFILSACLFRERFRAKPQDRCWRVTGQYSLLAWQGLLQLCLQGLDPAGETF